MKKILFAVLAIMLVVGNGYAQEVKDMPKEFGGMVVGGVSANFIVQAINAETREVTLKDEAGEISIVKCGPEVRNFAQIAVGDNVKVDLVEMVTVIVSDSQVEPSRVDDVEMERAPLGEKPAGTIM